MCFTINKEKYYRISDISKIKNMSKQAIYSAIKNKRLIAHSISGITLIKEKDLNNFVKFARNNYTIDNKKVFSSKFLSIKEVAQKLNVNYQNVYLAIKKIDNPNLVQKMQKLWTINKQALPKIKSILKK